MSQFDLHMKRKRKVELHQTKIPRLIWTLRREIERLAWLLRTVRQQSRPPNLFQRLTGHPQHPLKQAGSVGTASTAASAFRAMQAIKPGTAPNNHQCKLASSASTRISKICRTSSASLQDHRLHVSQAFG